ncbi:MAG: hypothetical protein HUJ51_00270 [Eggerthellaceae bacterium]|nr:hypothetical protein [Eggerthellaceae bacterium]
MNYSVKIVTESMGDGLYVAMAAICTSCLSSYVYLAHYNLSEGTTCEEDDVDMSKYEKVSVQTVMRDGTTIIAKSKK